MTKPSVLVFDSGLGGLTVYREIVRMWPDADYVYAADDAVFPYGALTPPQLVARVDAVMAALIGRTRPDVVVIACHTASTLVLPHLRARYAIPFVGTVPAIKPAAEISRSRMASVLATPGTVARDYTRDLVAAHAGDCEITLVGSTGLAALAEQAMSGMAPTDAAIAAELAPCFREGEGGRRTDVVVMACTHYPLLLDRLKALAPWPVTWIDPAPAIARRTAHLLTEAGFTPGPTAAPDAPPPLARAIFTGGERLNAPLRAALAGFGLAEVEILPVDVSTTVAAAV